jgi:hypothetical protein
VAYHIAIDEVGRLTLARNKGATERLLPRHSLVFGFADTEFVRVEFRRNQSGAIDALIFHEPNATLAADRDVTNGAGRAKL